MDYRKIEITDLPKEEITHEMIFSLWFCNNNGAWVKVIGYHPWDKRYWVDFNTGFKRDELLNLEYALIPKE